jgi:hypothetical protein
MGTLPLKIPPAARKSAAPVAKREAREVRRRQPSEEQLEIFKLVARPLRHHVAEVLAVTKQPLNVLPIHGKAEIVARFLFYVLAPPVGVVVVAHVLGRVVETNVEEAAPTK